MNKPKLSKQGLLNEISSFHVPEKVMFVSIRGYYKDTMGKVGKNDIGIYDDAIFLLGPDIYVSYNGNTDPSRIGKDIAMLKAPQIIYYEPGIHGISHLSINNPEQKKILEQLVSTGKDVPGWTRSYWAFRQASNVTVIRNGKEETDSPAHRFWTNLHRGGEWTTSSLACQTVVASQFLEFRAQSYAAMERYSQKKIPCILIEQL